MRATTAIFLSVLVFLARPAAAQSVAPVIVVETSRGTFSVETFPGDAPLTVAHVVALVKSGFYDGQRVHRAIAGFVVQFGDPQTRDMSARALWGRGAAAGSGKPSAPPKSTAAASTSGARSAWRTWATPQRRTASST